MFECIYDFGILATGAELALILLAAGGTSVAVVSSVQQGRAAKKQAKGQSRIAERNALLAERQAESERQAARSEARKEQERGRRFLAGQEAAFGVSGVQIGRGTPLTTLIDTANKLKNEELEILKGGGFRAGSLEARGDIFRAQGSAAKARGRAASRASILTATGQGLSGSATTLSAINTAQQNQQARSG